MRVGAARSVPSGALRWWCVCLLFVVLCLFVVFARRIRKCVGGAVCVRWQGVWFGALVVCRAHGCGISEESSVGGLQGRGRWVFLQAFGAQTRLPVARLRWLLALCFSFVERALLSAVCRSLRVLVCRYNRLKKEASASPDWACARWRSLLLKNGTVTLWASFLYCALCCGAISPACLALLIAFELSCGCVGRLVGCALAPLSVSHLYCSLPRAATCLRACWGWCC